MDEKPSVVPVGSAENGRECAKRFLMAPLTRSQSERCRWLALGKRFSTLDRSIDELSFPYTLRFTGSFANG